MSMIKSGCMSNPQFSSASYLWGIKYRQVEKLWKANVISKYGVPTKIFGIKQTVNDLLEKMKNHGC